MSKVYDRAKSALLFSSLIGKMIINKRKLSDDIDNNYKICRDISKSIIEKSGVEFLVSGVNNIPDNGSVLIASNHRSFFDIIVLIAAIERTMSFVVADELYNYPFLKEYIDSINCVSVDRETTDPTALKKQLSDMKNRLKDDGLILFPEGKCNYLEDEIDEFKKGGFVAARNCKSIIVPTYIDVSNVTKLGRWVVPKDKIKVTFGNSFMPTDISDKKLSSSDIANYTRYKVLELKRVSKFY